MGCDITMNSQIKNEFGEWVVHDRDIYSDRNYILFGILCGCRDNTFKPIADWKGYPADSKDKMKEPHPYDNDYVTEGGDYYGYAGVSWLSLREIKSFDWEQEVPHHGFKMSESYFCTNVIPYLEACAQKFGGPDNVRIVFGFSV
jgi:hypothetical protein